MSDIVNLGIPICFRCQKSAEEIDEYVDAARDHNETEVPKLTPSEWMRSHEGTYNPETNRFCCTRCYIMIGMPAEPASSGRRWRAP